jgi:hypothetical protein
MQDRLLGAYDVSQREARLCVRTGPFSGLWGSEPTLPSADSW